MSFIFLISLSQRAVYQQRNSIYIILIKRTLAWKDYYWEPKNCTGIERFIISYSKQCHSFKFHNTSVSKVSCHMNWRYGDYDPIISSSGTLLYWSKQYKAWKQQFASASNKRLCFIKLLIKWSRTWHLPKARFGHVFWFTQFCWSSGYAVCQ